MPHFSRIPGLGDFGVPEPPSYDDEHEAVWQRILEDAEGDFWTWVELVGAVEESGGDPCDLSSRIERHRIHAVSLAAPTASYWYESAKAQMEKEGAE